MTFFAFIHQINNSNENYNFFVDNSLQALVASYHNKCLLLMQKNVQVCGCLDRS